VEGYHLWLISEMPPFTTSSSDVTEPDEDEGSCGDQLGSEGNSSGHKGKSRSKRLRKKNSSSKSSVCSSDGATIDQGQLLLLQFAKSALAMNPCMVRSAFDVAWWCYYPTPSKGWGHRRTRGDLTVGPCPKV